MADLSGNPLAGMYPQPSQNNSLASNPLQLLGVIGQLNQNAMFQRQFKATQAVGSALQSGIQPDGSYDPNMAMKNLGGNSDAAPMAGEGIKDILAARGANIDNATKNFGLMAGQNQQILNVLGPIAQNPKATKQDVLNVLPTLARLGIPGDMINNWKSGLSNDPATLRSQLSNLNSIAMGPSGAAGRVTGPVGPNGEPTTTSLGSIGQSGGPTLATGQSPIQVANQNEYLGDQTKAATTLANVRPLEQALPLIQQLSNSNFGPGSPELAKIKAGLATAGLIDPNTSDVTIRQEVNKKLLGYASGARDAGRSDNALSAALGSNPNLDLTQPANLSLVKNQIGMDKMDAALPLAAGGPNGYKDFKSKYYQGNDPRAFAINTMTPTEIGNLQKNLKGSDRDKFNRSLQIAIKSGIVTPPSAAAPGQ